jgi:AcrR family transcriptional regulator
MSSTRQVGRRPGDPEVTKHAILAAARERFGTVGFDRATIRAIAAEADVDPALIIHHFKNKQELFVAAHELPLHPADLIGQIVAAPAEERGELIARAYLAVLGSPGSPVLSLLRAAATNAHAASMLREFVEDAFLRDAAQLAGGRDAELRLALIGSHLIGVIYARELIGVSPLAERSIDDLVSAIAPTIQSYLEPVR